MSTPPRLSDAVEAFEARKLALIGDGVAAMAGEVDGGLLLTGSDLEREEINEQVRGYLPAGLVASALVGAPVAIGAAWVDGLLVGLTLAELRAKHEASERRG